MASAQIVACRRCSKKKSAPLSRLAASVGDPRASNAPIRSSDSVFGLGLGPILRAENVCPCRAYSVKGAGRCCSFSGRARGF
eukprot:962424-Pyramimonas_sp.AAC.1